MKSFFPWAGQVHPPVIPSDVLEYFGPDGDLKYEAVRLDLCMECAFNQGMYTTCVLWDNL